MGRDASLGTATLQATRSTKVKPRAGAAVDCPFAQVCELPQIKRRKTAAYSEPLELRAAAKWYPIRWQNTAFRTACGATSQSSMSSRTVPLSIPGASSITDYIAKLDPGADARQVIRDVEAFPTPSIFNEWTVDLLICGHMSDAVLRHWCGLMAWQASPVRPRSCRFLGRKSALLNPTCRHVEIMWLMGRFSGEVANYDVTAS